MMRNPKNEAHVLFHTDCREKKAVARSASKKVTHSGCRFTPRTQAQINAMNGPVLRYNLSLPMGWKQFTTLDAPLQRQYLEFLAVKFHVSETELPDLLGARYQAVSTFLSNRGLFGVMRDKVLAMPEEKRVPKLAEWREFCARQWSQPNAMDAVQPVVTATDTFEDASNACKAYRAKYGLSQKALAMELGCSPAAISRLECKRLPAHTCVEMTTRLKRLEECAPQFACATDTDCKEAPLLAPEIAEVVREVSVPKPVTEVTHTHIRQNNDAQAKTGTTLELSGSVRSIVSAIEKLFGKGDVHISVHVEL